MPSPTISNHPSAHNSAIELRERGATSATSAAGETRSRSGSQDDVRSLRSGNFPQVQGGSEQITRFVDNIIESVSSTHPSSPSLETADEIPSHVAALRADLQNLPANTIPIGRLAAQFQLEGAALRAMVTDSTTLEKLDSGALLKDAVADKLPRDLRQLLARDAIYNTINAGAPGSVAPPFSDHELNQAGITGSAGELAAHRAVLVDDAFKRVIPELEAAANGTPPNSNERAQVVDVKLAHQAFKIGIAAHENTLEMTVLNLKVRAEVASNEILAKPSTRTKNTQDAEAELADTQTALEQFSKGSNIVLQQDHLDDLNSRAIMENEPVASKLAKLAPQVFVGGGPQGLAVSGPTWGVVTNVAKKYLETYTEKLAPVAEALATQVICGTALGVSHKLASDGPRDTVQAVMELGGWARPPEASSLAQLYPDACGSMLDAEGRPQLVDPATVATENQNIQARRDDFANKSKRKDFGNVTTDNNGQSSFGEVNAGRDVLHSVGLDNVNSVTGRSITSTVGGLRMSTVANADQLALRFDDKPAYAAAKRPNPRDISTRLVTGMKKLNLAEADNRMDLYSKITSASAGMIVAEAMDKLLSQPLQAAIDTMPEGGGKIAAQATGLVAHAGIEYAKSYAVLGGFFSGAAAKADAKTAPGQSAAWQRLFTGPDNVFHPTKRTTAYDRDKEKGTWVRQAVNKFEGGLFQTVAQTAAVTMEKSTLGLPSVVSGAADLTKQAARKLGGSSGTAGQGDNQGSQV
jgi:hypothetical protein